MKWLDRMFGKKNVHEEKPGAPARQDLPKTDMNDEKTRRILIAKCLEVLKEQMDSHRNERVFVPCSVSCDFPGTRNEALIRVIPDASDRELCRLTASAVREGSDLCVMNYLFKGTRQEMDAWLGDEAHVEELIRCIAHLSASVDNKLD